MILLAAEDLSKPLDGKFHKDCSAVVCKVMGELDVTVTGHGKAGGADVAASA